MKIYDGEEPANVIEAAYYFPGDVVTGGQHAKLRQQQKEMEETITELNETVSDLDFNLKLVVGFVGVVAAIFVLVMMIVGIVNLLGM